MGDLLVPIASTATVRELQEAVARCGPRGFAGASLLRLFSFFVSLFGCSLWRPSHPHAAPACSRATKRAATMGLSAIEPICDLWTVALLDPDDCGACGVVW